MSPFAVDLGRHIRSKTSAWRTEPCMLRNPLSSYILIAIHRRGLTLSRFVLRSMRDINTTKVFLFDQDLSNEKS